MILVPTTAGTGSEVTPNCILTDVKPDGSHMKKGIVSPHILARTPSWTRCSPSPPRLP